MDVPRSTQEPFGPGAVLALAGALMVLSSWPVEGTDSPLGSFGILLGFLLAIAGYGLLLAGAATFGASHLSTTRHRGP